MPMSEQQTRLSGSHERKLRVLHFAPRICWPLDTGAKLRNYHLARILAERELITLLAFAEGERLHDELGFYRQVFSIHRDGHNSFPKVMRGAIGRTPLPLLNYTTRKMNQELKSIFSSQVFDIVQVESIHLMPYLATIRSARKRPLAVLDWHNIESELMTQYAERESSAFRRAYANRTAKLIGEFERRALREFDAHLVVSERDAEVLRGINPDARIFVIENGVDCAHYSDAGTDQASAKNRIVFVGSMDYHANIDAAVNFAHDVWPRVRDRKPELVFSIVGRDPAPEVRALESANGVEVTGTVEDVRRYYQEAIAAIVPLRVGGGSRLKILEAMAAGVPVVSTTLGAEGLGIHPGEDIMVADSSQELAESIIKVAEDDDLKQRIAKAGRALVVDRYDWSRLGARLLQVHEELVEPRSGAS
jgi:polysaccharide biosynthesis protein PslH